METSVAGMKHIQTQMDSIAESIVRLSEQSQTIGEIIASVNDLADQSNLHELGQKFKQLVEQYRV